MALAVAALLMGRGGAVVAGYGGLTGDGEQSLPRGVRELTALSAAAGSPTRGRRLVGEDVRHGRRASREPGHPRPRELPLGLAGGDAAEQSPCGRRRRLVPSAELGERR